MSTTDLPQGQPENPPEAGTASAPRRIGPRALALLLLVLPMVLAALWAVVGPSDRAGDRGSRPSGGPMASALADAKANSTFAKGGANRLSTGAEELSGGAEKMRTGGADLASGMDQLQAGIGQAGRGATEVSGGVNEVVGAVKGLAAVQGQIMAAVDDALGKLTGNEPDVAKAREALTWLKQQLITQGLNQDTLNRLDQLRNGASELARQLSASGAPLRDGVYSATNGSHQLRDGAAELANGAKELSTGAKAVSDSVSRTDDSLTRAAKALAVQQGDAGQEAAAAAEQMHRRTSAGVLGVGAAALLGTLLLWQGSATRGRRDTLLALGTLTAALVAWMLATADTLPATRSAAAVGLLLLTIGAAALLWRAVITVFSSWPGRLVAIVLLAGQIALAWWVWVAGSAPAGVQTLVSGTPLGQSTAGLDALLLGGRMPVAATAAVVLAAIAVCAALATRLGRGPQDSRSAPRSFGPARLLRRR